MKPRAVQAVAIGPTANLHGSYKFLLLGSGAIVVRRNFTKFTVTQEVIDRVEELAGAERDIHVNLMYSGTTYSTADPPEDEDENVINEVAGGDEDANEVELAVDDNTDDAPAGAAIDDDENQSVGEQADEIIADEADPLGDEGIGPNAADEVDDDLERDINIEDDVGGLGDPTRRTRSTTGGAPFFKLDDRNKATIASQFKDDYVIGRIYSQFVCNKKRGITYAQLALEQCLSPFSTPEDAFLFNQMSLNAGLKAFAAKAEEAVEKEFSQLHSQDVLRPMFANALSSLEKSEALRLIMTIKEKRDGRIKGRACADGRGLRGRISPEDATSPTVSTEAFAMSCAIDAKEGRTVVTCDVPGAYLHCKMDELCHVLLEGVLVDLYLKVNPSAAPMVETDERGKRVLFTRMHKALYGHMKSGRLFWMDISGRLKDLGFESNPDDLCVLNKVANGKQMTVVLHVDDLKISHVDGEEIEKVLSALEEAYGKLEVQRGKVLEFLGLTLDYRTKGVCKIGAESYIEKALESYEGKIKGEAKTPASDSIFQVRMMQSRSANRRGKNSTPPLLFSYGWQPWPGRTSSFPSVSWERGRRKQTKMTAPSSRGCCHTSLALKRCASPWGPATWKLSSGGPTRLSPFVPT